jgi:hypothetical protein
MRSNVKRNFGMSLSLGDTILLCHMLQWGIQSNYTSAPNNVVIGAGVVALPCNPVALARTFHTLSGQWTRAYILGKA